MNKYSMTPPTPEESQELLDAYKGGGLFGLFPSATLDALGRPQQAVLGSAIEGTEGMRKGLLGGTEYTDEDFVDAIPNLRAVVRGASNVTGVPEGVFETGVGMVVDPLTYTGAGLLKNAKKGIDEAVELAGGPKKALEHIAGAPDNLLPGYYGSPIEKAKAMFNFAVDSVDSTLRSLNPEAAKQFADTGYNPVLLKKLNNFVEDRQNILEVKGKLEKQKEALVAQGGAKTPLDKELGLKIRELAKEASTANRRIEAQLQHPTYIALRSGIPGEDLPPLYKAMLDKMSVNGSGANPLSFETYKDISNSSRSAVKGSKTPLPRGSVKLRENLFNKALENWGVKNKDDYLLVVRQQDTENPFFDKDLGPIHKLIAPLFNKRNSYPDVDTLYNEIKNRQQTKGYMSEQLGMVKQNLKAEGDDIITVNGVKFKVSDSTLRKGEGGVYMSVKGFPKYTMKEISSYIAEENARRVASNVRRKKQGEPLKEPLSLEEKKKIIKRLRGDSPGVKSKSFLEGGINFEVFIGTNGRMTTVISDDYNFLENILPSLEKSFEKKILGMTPPMVTDLTKRTAAGEASIKGTHVAPAPNVKDRIIPKKRDALIQEAAKGAADTSIPGKIQGGMLGAGLIASPRPNNDN